MSKKRLYEIAKELGKESKEVVTRAKELGLEVKSHASSIEGEAVITVIGKYINKGKGYSMVKVTDNQNLDRWSIF